MKAIQYIGSREYHRDVTYGTGEWAKGQTKSVSPAIALKMLRHPDVYIESVEDSDEIVVQPVDKANDDEKARTDDLLLTIQTMSKEAAVDFAKAHFQRNLDKRKSVENLRIDAANLLHQYGAVQ